MPPPPLAGRANGCECCSVATLNRRCAAPRLLARVPFIPKFTVFFFCCFSFISIVHRAAFFILFSRKRWVSWTWKCSFIFMNIIFFFYYYFCLQLCSWLYCCDCVCVWRFDKAAHAAHAAFCVWIDRTLTSFPFSFFSIVETNICVRYLYGFGLWLAVCRSMCLCVFVCVVSAGTRFEGGKIEGNFVKW